MAQSRQPSKKPGFLETLRQSGRPPRAIVRPTGVGPKGKRGQRKAVSAKAGPNGASVVGTPVGQPELLKQREELSRKFAELQWDLGYPYALVLMFLTSLVLYLVFRSRGWL